MKKRIFVLILLGSFYVTHIFSQTDEVIITWPMVVAEAKKTDEHIANPKKSSKSRTWTERGRKYLEVYAFDLKGAFPGMKTEDIIHVMKTNAKSQTSIGDTLTYSFDRIDLKFVNNKLISYTRTGDALDMFKSH